MTKRIDAIYRYRKFLYEHFGLRTYVCPNGTGRAYGHPVAADLYNALAEIHKGTK